MIDPVHKDPFELEQAEAELNFWRDFVDWWKDKHGQPIEPRTLEALANAEKRYRAARKLLGTVPTRNGKIMDMLIVHLVEATAIDGIPVDLVVEARATKAAPVKRFALVFHEEQPTEDYPIPTLWVSDGTGVWLGI